MPSVSMRLEILSEQASRLYQSDLAAVAANIINATILVFALRDIANPLYSALWTMSLATLILVRLVLLIAFRKRQPRAETIKPWVTGKIIEMALFGTLWGASAWVFMPLGQPQYHMLTGMIIFIMAAGAMTGLYPVFATYVAYIIPLMVLLLLRLWVIGTNLHLAMAASGIMTLLILLHIAKKQSDGLMSALVLRLQNRSLLARVESENEKVRSENEEMARMETLLRQQSAVLDAVSQVQGLFIAEREQGNVFDETLATILRLTRSEYGFIGEVLTDNEGARYLKTFSASDISWDDDSRQFYKENAPLGIEFRNHKSLLGEVLTTGEPVIANDPANDQRAGGLPEGHPPLHTFLGVPLYMDEKMVGMIGLANRPGGYDYELLIAMDPVVNSAASMVEAVQNRRDRDQAQQQAASAMERLTTAIEALNDGFVIFDSEDRMVLCNSKYKNIYSEIAEHLRPGISFEEILRAGIERNQYECDAEQKEEWVQNRLSIHSLKDSLLEQKMANGTWLRIEERETPDGGRVGIRVDITELKRVQEDLKNAVLETEKSSKAKTEFLSSMSHELRTPMNAVLGFAQLLEMNPLVPLHPKQRDAVEQILKAGNHLLELINEILDLSRIEAGRINLSFEDVDPHDVVEECLAYVAPLAQKRDIALDIDVPALRDFTIYADPTRFKQVLLNLLSNAVKYNVNKGRVKLSFNSVDDDTVRFSISDTGPGIPADKQDELFKPFSRLGAETTDVEGTGIGLTIARRIAELMGGHLNFESTLGEGSTFWVDLPGSKRNASKRELKDKDETNLPIMPEGTHKVLYVEDNPDNLSLMQYIIAMVEGVDMISAHTAELGIEMAEIHKPDVILMDINLPGINGIEALTRLRALPEIRDTPVLAVSADVMPADIKIAMDAGFDAYITKPINLVEIVEIIRSAIMGKLGPQIDIKNNI